MQTNDATIDRFANLEIAPSPAKPAKKSRLDSIIDAHLKPNAEAFEPQSRTGIAVKSVTRKGDKVYNGLGLESTEEHKHVAKVWQEQCTPLSDLIIDIRTQQTTKRDVIASRKEVRVQAGEKGLVTLNDLPTLPAGTPVFDSGLMGLSEFTEVPREMIKYLMRDPTTDARKDLCKYINSELDKTKPKLSDKNFLTRIRKDKDGIEGVRHVASDSYAIIDNIDIAEFLTEAFKSHGFKDVLVSHAHNDIDTIYCNLLIPDLMKAYPDSEYGVGVAITNSEIGQRTFQFNPFLFRAICLNGQIWGKQKAKIRVHQKHSGQIDKGAIASAVANSLQVSLDGGWSMLERTLWAKDAKVESIEGTITYLSRQHRLSKGQAQAWYDAFQAEPEKNGFGIIQGLTRAAQGYEGESRYEMECLGGQIAAPSLEMDLRSIMSHWDDIDRMGAKTPEKIIEQYVAVRA